jgi:mannose-1-phosphate guanylyltransferase
MAGEEVSPGVILAGDQSLPEDIEIDGAAWIGHDVRIGNGVRLMGPVVLGDGARVGDRAQLRESIVFPGTEVADESILIGAIAGHSGILESLRRARQSELKNEWTSATPRRRIENLS